MFNYFAKLYADSHNYPWAGNEEDLSRYVPSVCFNLYFSLDFRKFLHTIHFLYLLKKKTQQILSLSVLKMFLYTHIYIPNLIILISGSLAASIPLRFSESNRRGGGNFGRLDIIREE